METNEILDRLANIEEQECNEFGEAISSLRVLLRRAEYLSPNEELLS